MQASKYKTGREKKSRPWVLIAVALVIVSVLLAFVAYGLSNSPPKTNNTVIVYEWQAEYLNVMDPGAGDYVGRGVVNSVVPLPLDSICDDPDLQNSNPMKPGTCKVVKTYTYTPGK